jgi:hypothetical protein
MIPGDLPCIVLEISAKIKVRLISTISEYRVAETPPFDWSEVFAGTSVLAMA